MPRQVLVVEDEPDLRDGLAELLSIWGYRVHTVCNGRAALDWLWSGRDPVLVLLDLEMPVMTGDEFLGELSERPPARRFGIVVLSANRDVQRRRELGHVVAALNKPVPTDRLHATIEHEIDVLGETLLPS